MTEVITIDKRSRVTQIIKEYSSRLFGFIRRRVNSKEDAEDVLQDVWYQFSQVMSVEPIDQVNAWLHKVATRKIIDRHRKKKETSLDAIDALEDVKDVLLGEDPQTRMLRNFFWEELFAALDELPIEQRQVFIWHEMEDLSFADISQKTGINTNTLISRKRYAVLHLRERLGDLYKELSED